MNTNYIRQRPQQQHTRTRRQTEHRTRVQAEPNSKSFTNDDGGNRGKCCVGDAAADGGGAATEAQLTEGFFFRGVLGAVVVGGGEGAFFLTLLAADVRFVVALALAPALALALAALALGLRCAAGLRPNSDRTLAADADRRGRLAGVGGGPAAAPLGARALEEDLTLPRRTEAPPLRPPVRRGARPR